MHANRLIKEKSPYLLQHAHNPVNWYPWGEEAFAKARRENRPIFLSVGYSTCHWCHVMEHESFENEETAETLNSHFVCIKVDREERPDVDRVYMTFVQATTGGGGWPMNVWLTPDLKPFFGGTYFPPQQLVPVAEKIAELWQANRAGIIASSDQIISTMKNAARPERATHEAPAGNITSSAFRQISSLFDDKLGGFGPPPKFPLPSTLNFLFHFHAAMPESPDGRHALNMALFTLRRMAAGGIHDQLGGGFHRYSVDGSWHVPHFEKMLYDQAQLATAYLTAFQITHEPQYRQTALDILDYVRRDMTAPEGGFYSAEDADSKIAGGSGDHAEGAFYVWTLDGVRTVLGPELSKQFAYRFGIEAAGNVAAASDPRNEFAGRNILFECHTLTETMQKYGLTPAQAEESQATCRARLLKARDKRPRPGRDDKIITAWNGLMISSFARAAQILDDPACSDTAARAAGFVRDNLYRSSDRTLLRSYREGAGTTCGFADDYAFMIQGLLDLYETTFDSGWLEWAATLQTRQDELFFDTEAGGYFTTTCSASDILIRAKEYFDGAEPSANSIAALNLLRLSQMLDRKDWRKRAEGTLHAPGPHLQQAPSGMPLMLIALNRLKSEPAQIIIAGSRDAQDTKALIRETHRHYMPNRIILLADGAGGQKLLAGHVPAMKDITPLDGRATAYVCRNFVCQLPATDPKTLAGILERND